MNDNVLILEKIYKNYSEAGGMLEVLKGVDLHIKSGKVIALLGPSGSGKSTLLHIAGLLDKQDSGEIYINDKACSKLGDNDKTKIRRNSIGFVYQFHHLMPELTALENVTLPQLLAGINITDANKKSEKMLSRMGLSDRLTHKPSQLSGGQQQRVAVARALINNPSLLLADEPTGNLDEHTANDLISDLFTLAHETGLSALIATHNSEFAALADARISLKDGHLSSDA